MIEHLFVAHVLQSPTGWDFYDEIEIDFIGTEQFTSVDLPSRIAILGAILAASSIVLASVLIIPPEPEPVDPFRDVVFFSERAAYAVGEEATFCPPGTTGS